MSTESLVTPRILLVDDEPAILAGLRRLLRGEFEIVTATGAAAGLELLERQGPFAAVVSDMRMPVMDGARFLARARVVAGDTVRILLTGHADVETAISAVNDAHIFRFLTKPCPIDTLVGCLRDAVAVHRAHARPADEYALWYQPVLDLASGRATGAEAVLRRRPDDGVPPAADGVPPAADAGPDVGRWALHKACQDAANWPCDKEMAPLTVAVRLSAAQFADPRLADDVAHALTRNGLPAGRLVLVVPESSLLSDADFVYPTLHALRAMGVAIAVADDGTGYSSLSYLQKLPVDMLKVTRSFVMPLPSSSSCAAAEAIVTRGHTVQLGPEAAEVEAGGGRPFAGPMDADRFAEFVRSRCQTGV
jgi:EAL domain-containing protein (putative c-di-GMP-specific phosphodiesterase class I)